MACKRSSVRPRYSPPERLSFDDRFFLFSFCPCGAWGGLGRAQSSFGTNDTIKGKDLVCKQPILALCLCPCFSGLRPRAPNTAVLTLRYGCGDSYVHCSPMAAPYGIPASSQLKLRPSTPMGVQEIMQIWFASNLSLPLFVSLLRRSAPSRYEYRRTHLKVRLRG